MGSFRWLGFAATALLVALVALGPGGRAAASPHVLVVDDDGKAVVGDCDALTSAYNSIQAAIGDASPGDTILVCPGTYGEALTIAKGGLTIEGVDGGPTIRPTSGVVTTSLFSGAQHEAVVLVNKAKNVTLRNLTVDGADAAAKLGVCPTKGLFGIFYRGASGTIDSVHVTNIMFDDPDTEAGIGCQQAHLAIFVQSGKEGGLSAPGPRLKASAVIRDSTVDDYAKNGITCNEAGTFCRIEGNTATGLGLRDDIGQNGIQLGFGATGAVLNNHVTDHNYTGPDIACGIIVFWAGGVVTGNTFAGNEVDVCNSGSQSVPQHPPVQP